MIERKKPYKKGESIYRSGDKLHALYAIRSGSVKSYVITEKGEEQITAFHFAGDVFGFDAIMDEQHPSFASALETSMICELPYDSIELLSSQIPEATKTNTTV